MLLFPLLCLSCQTTGGKSLSKTIKESTDSIAVMIKQSAQKMGKTIGKGDSYNIFYDQGDHLKELIEEGNFEEAANLYSAHKSFFQKKGDKYQSQLKIVAEKLNSAKEPQFKNAIQKVEVLIWPAHESEWPIIKETINEATNILESYNSTPMLIEPLYRFPLANTLESKLNELVAVIKENSGIQFSSFNHFSDKSFFKFYPIDIDGYSFMNENISLIQSKIKSANTRQIKQFILLYPREDILSQDCFEEISNQYVDCCLREKKGAGPLSLQIIVNSIKDAEEEGFKPTKIPNLKIGFAEVASKILRAKGQIEFPYQIEIDIPFETIKINLEDLLAKENTDSIDYLIVINGVASKAYRKVINEEKVSSEYISGTKRDPNPAYETAKFNVIQAQNDLANAQRQNTSNNPYASPMANLIGTLSKGIGVIAQRNRYNQAIAELNTTPQFTESSVYQTYEFNKSQIDVSKALFVNYYIIDFNKNNYFKSTFGVNKKQSFNIVYNMHIKDVNRRNTLSHTNTEADLNKWKKEPILINLSNIIDHYLANFEKVKKLPIHTALKKEMSKDRNLALSKFKVKIEGEANYTYGDDMSLVQARKFCKDLAIRNALDNYCTFLISETRARDFQIESDQIYSLAAGYVRGIKEEKLKVKGRTLYYKISGYVDESEIKQLIEEKIASQKP